jgi:tetratricopeptide (TPR) repeat protein
MALLFPAPAFGAQPPTEGSLEWYSNRSKEAISQSNYETAVKILTEAKTRYPKASALNIALADLFYDKELYTLALGEYQEAERKGDKDFHTLNQIARSYGKLGKDRTAIDSLNRILTLYPESQETMDDLGWMYFKTNQLEKGEKILTEGISKFGMQRGMAMTLGTIYSGMNRYGRSREYYLKSIDEALKADDRYFASIAYYNLSLLEHAFFHYNSALRATEDSISMEDRSSGHLARGELYESRMDYRNAEAEYEKAFALDTTPLTKVNMAILHQLFGHLELARRYAEEALGTKDLAWMLYYGTDVPRHFKDIHEILARIHAGMAAVDAAQPTAGPLARVVSLASALRHRILAWYHGDRFRLLSLDIGKGYLAEGRAEEAYWEFYKASEVYPDVAASYLSRARALETARTPHAEAFYRQEEGRLSGSADELRDSLRSFDPFWEKEATADSLRYLIPLLSRRGEAAARRKALNRLYEINPGALLQNGLGLPLVVRVAESQWGVGEKALIFRYLKRAHSELAVAGEAPGGGFRYELTLRLLPGGRARYTVVEEESGRTVADAERELAGNRWKRCSRLVQWILDDTYKVE